MHHRRASNDQRCTGACDDIKMREIGIGECAIVDHAGAVRQHNDAVLQVHLAQSKGRKESFVGQRASPVDHNCVRASIDLRLS